MLILKEDEFYQVEEFCSFFEDYKKALSTIEILVKEGYLEKTHLKRKRKGFTLYFRFENCEKVDDPIPVMFYVVCKEIDIVI